MDDWLIRCDIRTHYVGLVPGTDDPPERATPIDAHDPVVVSNIPRPLARWLVGWYNVPVGRVYYVTSCR